MHEGDGTCPRIIVVTGTPRSGTTAVGHLLSLGGTVGGLHEPLNYHVGVREVDAYFEFVGDRAARLDAIVRGIRALRLRFKPGIFPEDRGLWRMFKRVAGGRAVNSYRSCRLNAWLDTIVWKDPFAALVSDYLAVHHHVDVVVTVRSPWAVAASFTRMGWGFDLPALVGRLRHAGLEWAVPEVALDGLPPAMNGAVLWHITYALAMRWSAANARLFLLDIDQLVRAPVATYEALYQRLRLPWSKRTAKRITRAYRSGPGDGAPRGRKAHDRRRDLREVNTYWQRLLGEPEAAEINRVAGALWKSMQRAGVAGGAAGPGDAAPGVTQAATGGEAR